jgi:hypothetical protein
MKIKCSQIKFVHASDIGEIVWSQNLYNIHMGWPNPRLYVTPALNPQVS